MRDHLAGTVKGVPLQSAAATIATREGTVAEHSLADVRRLIDCGNYDIDTAGALDCVVGNWDPLPGMNIAGLQLNATSARKLICEKIEALAEGDFYETVRNFNPPADVYRVRAPDGKDWYVKFAINNNWLEVISFHLPLHRMR